MTYIRETFPSSDKTSGVSFKASELESIYADLLKEKCIEYTPHDTHFTSKLLSALPDLGKRLINNKVTLLMKEDIDANLQDDVSEPDIFIKLLNKVVRPLRKAMILQKNDLNGTFSANCQYNSVPKELLAFITILIDGTNINAKISQSSLSCAQMIMSNFNPNRKCGNNSSTCENKVTSHSKKRETPLLLYNSSKLYGSFRSETVISSLFHIGICLPYYRILEITKCISETIINQFEKFKCFIPGL